MERPRPFLVSVTTSSVTYVDLINTYVSNDAKGVSALYAGINPDPNAVYRIFIGKIMMVTDVALNVIWDLTMEHIDKGWYQGLTQGDPLLIQVRSPTGVSTTTNATLYLSEVVPVELH